MKKLTVVAIIGGFVLSLYGASLHAAPSQTLVASQSAVHLDTAEVEKVAQKKVKKKDKRVCRRIKMTGSRIKERVCRKQSQWDAQERLAKENAETSYEGARRNTSTTQQQ